MLKMLARKPHRFVAFAVRRIYLQAVAELGDAVEPDGVGVEGGVVADGACGLVVLAVDVDVCFFLGRGRGGGRDGSSLLVVGCGYGAGVGAMIEGVAVGAERVEVGVAL